MTSDSDRAPEGRPRILSIDLLRGLDVWLMLFVNEVAGVAGAPAFLKHFEPRRTGDGMTITDIVFPAFLFIVGLAIPFALGGRRQRGESTLSLWQHVLVRTAALLVMGVMVVNADDASASGLLSGPAWTVLMVIAVVLAWQSPAEGAPRWMRFLRPLGWLLLAVAVFTFRSDAVQSFIEIRPSWWGILGLIGWSYLVAATIYLLAGDRQGVLVGGVTLLYALYLADEAGRSFTASIPFVDVGRFLGAHAAVALSGVVLGVMLKERRAGGVRLAAAGIGFALAMAAGAWMLHAMRDLHPAFTINKIRATAPWCLYSAAWTAAAWSALYWLADVKGVRRWPRSITMAGENALLAYLLPSLLLALFVLSAPLFGGVNPYHAILGGSVWGGLVRSAVFAWVVIRLCGLLRTAGIRMQL
jgi:heparan-alpha-glucosaminide N-acetyltransferase